MSSWGVKESKDPSWNHHTDQLSSYTKHYFIQKYEYSSLTERIFFTAEKAVMSNPTCTQIIPKRQVPTKRSPLCFKFRNQSRSWFRLGWAFLYLWKVQFQELSLSPSLFPFLQGLFFIVWRPRLRSLPKMPCCEDIQLQEYAEERRLLGIP